MKMIKQPTIPPMPKRPTFDARDTQYNLPIGTDLISRQAAIDAVTEELDMIDHVSQWVFDRLEGRLKQLPPAQPKIIYCKDCIHHSKHNDDYMCGVNVLAYVRETDYCSRGERRIDE